MCIRDRDDAQTDAVFLTVNGVRCLRILVANSVSAVEKEVWLPWDATYPDMFDAVRTVFDVHTKGFPVSMSLWYASNWEPVNFWPHRLLTGIWHDRKLLVYFYR